jgi:hypothetical protein
VLAEQGGLPEPTGRVLGARIRDGRS